MRRSNSLICIVFLAVFTCMSLPTDSIAAKEQYDLVYIWDTDLESVLDYKDQLDEIFESDVSKRLKVVGRGNEYGVIYDTNGSAKSVGQEIAHHGEILRKAGLKEAWAIVDHGYHRLFNVSYGLGPNLESLKKTYNKLYGYLGEEVGKSLFIEKTSADNYTLIYRRRGDRHSTMQIAQKHARLLRGKKIKTSITPENNNEIVYGESSLLDATDSSSEVVAEVKPGPVHQLPKVEETPQPSLVPEAIVYLKKDETKNLLMAKGENVAKATPVPRVSTATRTEFENNIEEFIKELRRTGKIRSDEKTGWMVYDLENDRSLVNINADELFQAASMIKPFVALAYFHEVNAGRLSYGPKSRSMVEAMIQRSSNSATNWVMRQAGGPARCEQILRSNYSSIFKNTVIKEYIPASGRTYQNSALPSDYIRFLRALWNTQIPYGKELRRIMALPGRDRLYHGTPIPQGTLVYNKTGSTAHLCGDMGILVPKTTKGQRHPYAIVGIIERSSRPSDYGGWMLARGNVIRQVSTLVYKEMKKQYKLL
jgi:beta-lactamase class A